MNHMIPKGILEVLFIIFSYNLLEEIIGIPVVKPGTASYLLIPGVTKVVTPTLSPPEKRASQCWFVDKIGQEVSVLPSSLVTSISVRST